MPLSFDLRILKLENQKLTTVPWCLFRSTWTWLRLDRERPWIADHRKEQTRTPRPICYRSRCQTCATCRLLSLNRNLFSACTRWVPRPATVRDCRSLRCAPPVWKYGQFFLDFTALHFRKLDFFECLNPTSSFFFKNPTFHLPYIKLHWRFMET